MHAYTCIYARARACTRSSMPAHAHTRTDTYTHTHNHCKHVCACGHSFASTCTFTRPRCSCQHPYLPALLMVASGCEEADAPTATAHSYDESLIFVARFMGAKRIIHKYITFQHTYLSFRRGTGPPHGPKVRTVRRTRVSCIASEVTALLLEPLSAGLYLFVILFVQCVVAIRALSMSFSCSLILRLSIWTWRPSSRQPVNSVHLWLMYYLPPVPSKK